MIIRFVCIIIVIKSSVKIVFDPYRETTATGFLRKFIAVA